MDCRRSGKTKHGPLLIHGEAVERVDNIKFLGVMCPAKALLPQEAKTEQILFSAAHELLQSHKRKYHLS